VSVFRPGLAAIVVGLAFAIAADAQTFREHSRSARRAEQGTVEESQAGEITLTVAPVVKQSIQHWIRTAGALDAARENLSGCVYAPDAALVHEGQRVRSFPPDSKSSIYQARVARVTPGDSCTRVEAELSGPAYGDASRFVMEIIVVLGEFLAVPNEAIIEREGRQVVYVQRQPGRYEPLEIHTGREGELYTEVLHGLAEGDQVVTIGSFFIDADYRLKSDTGADAAGDAHHNH